MKNDVLDAMGVQLKLGDCLESLRLMADNSVDSIVTDPPYGLKFMGKKWDYDVPSVDIWRECLRVLKPGGHLLAFAGTRTQHRMAVRIEDAGFEIRDMIAWVYGSGFPKSLDVSKAIDGKLTTGRSDSIALREVNETRPGEATVRQQSQNGHAGFVGSGDVGPSVKRDTPATDAARQWQGWGTALKPALEPITVARKPLIGTVAANVLKHGTGAINVDGCRVAHVTVDGGNLALNPHLRSHINGGNGGHIIATETERRVVTPDVAGRWPANLIHDGSEEVLAAFPQAPGQQGRARTDGAAQDNAVFSALNHVTKQPEPRGDAGSAARFFYCAKASKRDRDEGLDHLPAVDRPNGNKWTDTDYRVLNGERGEGRESGPRRNVHPTVKPTDLMRYLCRLVTPPGGTVLDAFMGSGSTGKAAVLEGFNFIGCEISPDSMAIAQSRILNAILLRKSQMGLFATIPVHVKGSVRRDGTRVADTLNGFTPEQRAKMLDMMATLGGVSANEVHQALRASTDNHLAAKPADGEPDLFSQPEASAPAPAPAADKPAWSAARSAQAAEFLRIVS